MGDFYLVLGFSTGTGMDLTGHHSELHGSFLSLLGELSLQGDKKAKKHGKGSGPSDPS